jgi:hypothetical protein
LRASISALTCGSTSSDPGRHLVDFSVTVISLVSLIRTFPQ